jgi:hypothetical protein
MSNFDDMANLGFKIYQKCVGLDCESSAMKLSQLLQSLRSSVGVSDGAVRFATLKSLIGAIRSGFGENPYVDDINALLSQLEGMAAKWGGANVAGKENPWTTGEIMAVVKDLSSRMNRSPSEDEVLREMGRVRGMARGRSGEDFAGAARELEESRKLVEKALNYSTLNGK